MLKEILSFFNLFGVQWNIKFDYNQVTYRFGCCCNYLYKESKNIKLFEQPRKIYFTKIKKRTWKRQKFIQEAEYLFTIASLK